MEPQRSQRNTLCPQKGLLKEISERQRCLRADEPVEIEVMIERKTARKCPG